MKASFFLILALAATTLGAQSDPEHPMPLQTSVLDATTHGEGGNSYYQFAAGPGEMTVEVQASTDDYSSPVDIEVLRGNGKSIGSINVVATDSIGRASRTFHLPVRDDIVLKVATRNDSHVKWLKYRIALQGATDLQTPTGTSATQTTPVALPAAGTEGDLALDILAQLLDSMPPLPASGTLRIDMKDGTFRLLPLAQVQRLSVVRPK